MKTSAAPKPINYGTTQVYIPAPGDRVVGQPIQSPTLSDSVDLSGTRSTAPIVVGNAALLMAANPSLKPEQAANLLTSKNQQSAANTWGQSQGGVTIAVLNTGIDSSHPGLNDRVLAEKDFTGLGLQDTNGQGTHVAGIICGISA